MSKLLGLRQELGKAIDEMEKHAEAGGDAYDAAKKAVGDLKEKIARLAETEAEKATAATPTESTVKAEPQPKTPEVKGAGFARIVLSLAATKGIPQLAAEFAAKTFGRAGEGVAKALAAGSGAAGGFLVKDQYADEIIEMLRARIVTMRAGARTLPMPGGSLLVPRITAGSTAAYVGENQNMTKTEPTFGQVKLTAKKLAALVPISNDLIRFASPQTDQVVRDDLLAGMQVAADAEFIRGTGTVNGPKGIRYWATPTASQVIAANGTVTLSNVTTDLGKAELAVMAANTAMLKPGYIMAPRSLNYLRNVRDANGVLGFPEVNQTFQASDPSRPAAMLRGYPVWTTTSVPVNLGGGSDESEVYFGDFQEVVVGEVPGLIVDASDTAAYHDGSNVVAAFSQDQTVIRAIMQHDLALRHGTSFAVLTGVKWS